MKGHRSRPSLGLKEVILKWVSMDPIHRLVLQITSTPNHPDLLSLSPAGLLLTQKKHKTLPGDLNPLTTRVPRDPLWKQATACFALRVPLGHHHR
jgi:hypothetical protein